jgi:hypothetical protein
LASPYATKALMEAPAPGMMPMIVPRMLDRSRRSFIPMSFSQTNRRTPLRRIRGAMACAGFSSWFRMLPTANSPSRDGTSGMPATSW